MSYDWLAALAFVAATVVLSVIGSLLAFRIPALREMRELNRQQDRIKLSRQQFSDAVKRNGRVGLLTNLVFLVALLPLCVNLEPRPLWRHAVDIVVVLMIFDFFYYLVHRFVFHGKLMRKAHSLHHQARTPTSIDALYVHPLETSIGLGLFLGSIPLVAAFSGPLNAVSMAVATLIFSQVNALNHAYVNLPYSPFKTLDYITSIHAE
jgi:sterol desaturase/sphingolipid hydroxylase (fatty acid hydroxylase superfamily)